MTWFPDRVPTGFSNSETDPVSSEISDLLIIRLYQGNFRVMSTVLKTSREWSSNKRSNLFFTEFNVRVQIELGSQPEWGTNREIKASTKFLCIILDFHTMLC